MGHLKAILFRRDRLWLAALLGAVGLVAIATYVFFVTQPQMAQAWLTTDTGYLNNTVSSDTVAMGETNILVLDVTLPNPTTDVLAHDGASFAVAAEDTLVDFAANDRFSDTDHDDALDYGSGGNPDGALIVNSADTTISSGEVITAGTADLTAFGANEKYADTDHDDATDDYSGTELVVLSANTTILVAEVLNAGTVDFTAFDSAEPAIEVYGDSTDDNLFDAANDAGTEDIFRQVHDGTDVFSSGGLLEDFAATEVFYDDNDTNNNFYDDGEAVITDADSDNRPSAGDTVLTAGDAKVIALTTSDNVCFDTDAGGAAEYDTGDDIWVDINATDCVTFDTGVDVIVVGGTIGVSSEFGTEQEVFFLDENNDGLYTCTRAGTCEPIVQDSNVNHADGDDLPLTATFFDSSTDGTDGISVTGAGWDEAAGVEDMNLFNAGYLFVSAGASYVDGADIFSVIHDGTADGAFCAAAACDEREVRTMGANEKFADTDDDGIYDDGELIGLSADPSLAAAEILVSGTVDISAFHANFKYSDFDNGGTYDAGNLIVNDANTDSNVSGAEIVLAGFVDVTAFTSGTTPFFKLFGGSTYTDGDDIVSDLDNSDYYNADRITGLRINNAGTALDADLDAMKFWQENATAGFQSGIDTLIFTDDDGAYFNSAETFTTDWFVYSTGSSDQRFYVTIDMDVTGGGDGDPTNAATVIATLNSTTGDGNCSTDAEAACAVNLSSSTISDVATTSGGDGPEGAVTITSAGTITIDSVVPTIDNIYTLDGYNTVGTPSTCLNSDNITPAIVDGELDAFCIDFSEAILDSSVTIGNFAVTSETVGSFDTGGTVNDDMILLIVTAGFYATDGTPNVAYTAGTLTDSIGNLLATDATTTPTDLAPPAIINSETIDSDDNGTVDQLLLTFSEGTKIVDGAAGDGFAPLVLTATTGSATIASANYGQASTTSLTLNLTGTTANNTGLTIAATYDDDLDGTKGICDDDVSNANCIVDYATANQMIDGEATSEVSETDDGASPVVVSASTTSDNDIAILFSEDVTGAAAGDLTTNSGAMAFAAVDSGEGTTITWQNATTAWNTDATGASAGSGTDSTGTVRSTVPNLTMSLGAVADASGNNIAVLASDTRTVDAAGPIALSASYKDVTVVNGTIDRVDVVFSETLAVTYAAGDWNFSTPGDMNLVDSAATVSTNTLRLAVTADANETGGVAPHLQYTNNANRLTDLALTPAAAGSFNTGAITDDADPIVVSASTTSDNDILITFSESVTGAVAGDLTTNSGAMAFAAVSAASGTAITWQNATTAWNTDATGASAGTGTDSGGTSRSTVPNLTMLIGAVVDSTSNQIAAFANATSTTDGAEPIAQSATYLDTNADGAIDRVDVDFSETVDVQGWGATDWTFPAVGSFASLVDSAAADVGDDVRLTVTSDANETGSGVSPTVLYENIAGNLRDASVGFNTSGGFGAAITITDAAAPIITARATADTDADGQIDAVNVTLSESVSDATFGTGAAGFTQNIGGAVDLTTGATANDALVRVVTTETGLSDTNSLPTLAYDTDDAQGTLADASGNGLGDAVATAATDGAAAVIVSSNPTDGENGVEDDLSFVIIFSEPMTTAAVDAAFSMLPDPAGLEGKTWAASGGNANSQLTVNPAADLERNEDYVLTIATGDLAAAVGDPNFAGDTISFETEGTSSGGGGGGGGGGTTSTEPTITVTAPTGSDAFDGGDVTTVDWAVTGSGINSVKLYYSVDGGDHYTLLASGLGKSETYDWTVPNTETDNAMIKVVALDSGSATLDSDESGAFSISLTSSLPEDEVPSSNDDELMTRDEANASFPEGIEVDDLVRATLPAVYYIGLDGKRHPFPNEQIYFTWFENFDGVRVITDAELAEVSLGTPILTRPGTLMVKIVSDPKTYLVTPGYELHWVTSEAAATALFGATWNQRIMDIEPTYFTHFSFGDDITDGTYPEGSLVMTADDSTVYYIDENGDRREVSADGMSENYFQDRFVTTSSDDSWMDFDLGDAIDGLEDALFSSQLP